MTRDEIESAVSLTVNANTDHEDEHEWYGSYGWHLSTEDAGDVCLQAVEWTWLDGSDDAAVDALMEADEDVRQDEATEIVERARAVREAAESICGLLDEAVEAYGRGDLDACRSALLSAYDQESDHGDAPAASSLAERLLSHEAYRVYQAEDGSDLVFCGERKSLDEAKELAESAPKGLSACMWGTARAAGNCDGMTAPDGGTEDDDPRSWHGERGNYCVVRVNYR